MSEIQKDGFPLYDALEIAAPKSDEAREKIEPPEFPEPLDYLWGWLMKVHRRSGFGMSGALPLTWTTLADWSRLDRVNPTPDEAEALFTLDGILLGGWKQVQEAEDG